MAKRGTLDDFKANVAADFARPNLFQVDLAFPTGIINNSSLINLGKFTVRAANLPSSQVGVIEVPFRGRVLKIAGDRTFEPWTITIQNDSNFSLRSAFELWSSSIQAYNENFTQAAGLGDAAATLPYQWLSHHAHLMLLRCLHLTRACLKWFPVRAEPIFPIAAA